MSLSGTCVTAMPRGAKARLDQPADARVVVDIEDSRTAAMLGR